jgi:hypothetical protein
MLDEVGVDRSGVAVGDVAARRHPRPDHVVVAALNSV